MPLSMLLLTFSSSPFFIDAIDAIFFAPFLDTLYFRADDIIFAAIFARYITPLFSDAALFFSMPLFHYSIFRVFADAAMPLYMPLTMPFSFFHTIFAFRRRRYYADASHHYFAIIIFIMLLRHAQDVTIRFIIVSLPFAICCFR